MKHGPVPAQFSRPGQLLLLAGAIIALVIASAFLGLTLKQDEMIRNYIEIAAGNYFDSIVITRRWNAGYGGVYVFKKEGMASNPYLKEPDIVTRDGKTYTMKNPALMTREISEMARGNGGGYQYHITSLKLMNPGNAPDAWEKESLGKFEAGLPQTTLIAEQDGKKVFRLMRPLFFEAGCVGCHGHQGYAVGDIRGGISVTLPYDAIAASLQKNRVQMLALAAMILICFVAVFYLGIWRLLSRLAATNAQLAEERENLGQLNAELDRKVEERTGELLAANEKLRQEVAERQEAERAAQQLNMELEQRVRGRTAELEKNNQELERLNKLFVDREFRIKELRDQVVELQGQAGVTSGGGGPG